MKLKYKISLIITLIGLVMLTTASYIYSIYSYKKVMNYETNILTNKSISTAHLIELELSEKLAVTKTIGSSILLIKSLKQSNNEYTLLNKTQQQNKIKLLNKSWKQAKSTKDPFIKKYLNNPLSLYLKSQQKVLPNTYGEIFITNAYGAMVATTGKLSTLAHSHKYWWKEAYNKGEGKVFFDDRGFDKSVDGYVVGITIPIKKDNQIIGILKANINIMGSLNNVIKHYSKLNHGKLKIVRTKGLVVLEANKSPLSTTIDSELKKPLESMKTGFILSENDIVAYSPVALTLNSSKISFGSKPSKVDHIKGNQDEAWHTIIRYNKDIALSSSRDINKIIIYSGIMITIILLFVSFILGNWISKPINNLAQVTNKIKDGEHNIRANENGNDEISELAKSFNNMIDDLHKTMISRDKLIKEVQKRKKAEINLKKQEEIMIAQSRHAAMGEMISMIAHQWRQPLSIISMSANNIMADIELDIVNSDSLLENSAGIIAQTQELSKTIDDFKNFFKPIKTAESILPEDIFYETFKVIGKSLENHNIKIVKHFNNGNKITTYSRELMQVLINIIKNAKEILIENDIKNKQITISIENKLDIISIKICDNAKGIPENIIKKIFNPYFSTKTEQNGTGLGLYMSKTIVERHLLGTLKAYNKKYGACFEIQLPYKI